jgi:serine/threonine protein kinase
VFTSPQDVNWRADIWSLAMVIAEILTGEVPFDSPLCRSMALDQFLAALQENMRPQLPPKLETSHIWLKELVRHAFLKWIIVNDLSI